MLRIPLFPEHHTVEESFQIFIKMTCLYGTGYCTMNAGLIRETGQPQIISVSENHP